MTDADVGVCLASGGSDEDRANTLASLREHTVDEITILALDERDDPFVATAPADVVLIEAGCVVAAGWLAGLREAAGVSSTTASATALTHYDLGVTATEGEPFEAAAATVRARSLRLRPRLGATSAGGPCVYVRRAAIDLIRDQDAVAPIRDEDGVDPAPDRNDFWRRCVERGLSHVLADDVLVLDPRPGPRPPDARTEPQARALGAAKRALHGLSVTVDARILTGPTTGTHVHVVELIAALARTEEPHLSAIIPDDPSPDALARLRAMPGVLLRTYDDRHEHRRADVVHRPYQLSNAGDLTFLASLGERLVLTQQDLIAYHNPSYFPTSADWEGYRQLTRLALAAADRVLFFSAHARDDALSEDLVAPARADVVHLGVDHPHSAAKRASTPTAAPPAGAERLSAGMPVILCLGTDFHHKNRLFALRTFAALRRDHGWDGVLVFAGPAVAHGSSRPQEARLLAGHPALAGAVLDLGAVGEAEKEWLFERCCLVVYPSVLEGFGLVPFEAAAHRVPCMWAPGSSLSELLPDAAAAIVPWDEARTAEHAKLLLGDDQARERNLKAIDVAASHLTWDATAARLLEIYEATAQAPASAARASDSAGMTAPLTEDAARLVGPGGELPVDVQRPLLALATHRRLAAPVFGALKLGYRVSHRVRRVRTNHRRR